MSYAAYDRPVFLTEGVLTRRVVAWCIDLLLIGVLAWLAWMAIFALGVLTLGLGFGLMAGLPLIGGLYHILFVAGPGCATPGQLMMDLSVRRAEDLGQPGLLRAIVFTVGLWLTLGTGFWLLFVALVTARKQALHDLVAGVVVVRNRALTRSPGFVNMGYGR